MRTGLKYFGQDMFVKGRNGGRLTLGRSTKNLHKVLLKLVNFK